MKSEYHRPKLLPGERPEPQIIIDAERLYALLLRAEMMMTKVDRIRYGNSATSLARPTATSVCFSTGTLTAKSVTSQSS